MILDLVQLEQPSTLGERDRHEIRVRPLSGAITAYSVGLSGDDILNTNPEILAERWFPDLGDRQNRVERDFFLSSVREHGLEATATVMGKIGQPLHLRGCQRSQRGQSGLTKLGKELIEDGIALLWNEQSISDHRLRLVFGTETEPTRWEDGSPMTAEDHLQVLKGRSTIVKRIREELLRLQDRLGIPKRCIYVNEIQDRRWKASGELSIHSHWVFFNEWDSRWLLTTADWDSIIKKAYFSALGRDVDVTSSGRLDPIHGMSKLGSYLSKMRKIGFYMGKASGVLNAVKQSSFGKFLPRSWYGADMQTRQVVRASSFRLPLLTPGMWQLKHLLEFVCEGMISPCHVVEIENNDGKTIPVALVTRVKRIDYIPAVIGILESLSRQGNDFWVRYWHLIKDKIFSGEIRKDKVSKGEDKIVYSSG